MPRIQPLTSLLRPLAAPRTAACTHHFRFSTATRLCAEKPAKSAKPSPPSQAPPAPPTTPQEASRAADLAAAEAITESDSAQPPEPKPDLPSGRAHVSSQTTKADDVVPPTAPTSHPNTESTLKKHTTTKSPGSTAATREPTKQSATSILKSNHEQRSQEHSKREELKFPPRSTPTTLSSKSPAAPTLTIDLPPPKYHVSRSKNGNFPIYTDYKRGGNLHLTMVRKITGDLSALRDELRVWLNKKNEDVKINSLTAQVIVKGHCKEEVQKYLQGRGF